MGAIVIETEFYSKKAARLLSTVERKAIVASLAENPGVHDIIPGLGGLRKARYGQQNRNKGKRGGVRVIYFFMLSAGMVFLLDIYSKAENVDLNEQDKKALRLAVEEIKKRA